MASPASLFLYEPRVVRIWSISPSRGTTAGGTTITIVGEGFAGVATGAPVVDLGGSTATVVSFTDTQIIATTDSHAEEIVDVTITNSDSEEGELPGGFEYAETDPPVDVVFRTPAGAVARLARVENAPARISQSLGQHFSMSFTSPIEPKGFDPISWSCYSQLLFDGMISSSLERTEGAAKTSVWDVACLGYSFLLSKRFPVGEWTNVDASTVLFELMNIFGQGFTYDIEPALGLITEKLDGSKDLWTVIVDVCERAGAKCFVHSTKLIVYTVVCSFDPPDPVTDDNEDLLWPENGQAVTRALDYTQIANSVTVYGAEGVKAKIENWESIQRFGVCPLPVYDNTLETVQECVDLAQSIIDAQALPVPTVRYATRDLKTMAGKSVSILVTTPEIEDDDWIIQSVEIDQLELLAVGKKPRFQVTAVPYWAPAMARAGGTTRLLQKASDVIAVQARQPRLTGAVVSDPGGPTIIPPASITNSQLAGCITTDQMRPGPNKDPVKAAASSNLVRSGLPVISGVPIEEGDRVLLTGQDDPTENGIYIASGATGLWARATDSDEDAQMPPGITVLDASTGVLYYLDADAPVVLGSSELRFLRVAGQGSSGPPVVLFLEDAADGFDGALVPGPPGPQGATGATGSGGAQGPQGAPGFVFEGDEEPLFAIGPPGPTGPAGRNATGTPEGGGAALRFTSEIADGAINGTNRIFSTANGYQHLEVFVNGLFQLKGWDYQELTATTFELTYAPLPASGVTPADLVTVNYDSIVGGTTEPIPPADGDPITATRVFPPRLDVSRPTYFGVVGTGFGGPTTGTTINVVGQPVSEYIAQGQGGTYRADPASAATLALAAGTYSISVSTNRAPNTVLLPNALIVESWAGNTIKYLEGDSRNLANMDSVEGIVLSKSAPGGGPSGMQHILTIWGSGFSNRLYLSANAAVTLGDVSVFTSHLGTNGSGALGAAVYDGTMGYIAIDLAGASLGAKDLIISSPIFAAGSVTFVGAITVVP